VALIVEAAFLVRAYTRGVAGGGLGTQIARVTGVLWGCVLINVVLLVWEFFYQA